MRSKLTPYLLVLFLSFQQLSVPSAFGKQCKGDTCIGVTTDDKSVVITVQKGKPGSSKTTKPAPKKPKTTKPSLDLSKDDITKKKMIFHAFKNTETYCYDLFMKALQLPDVNPVYES